MKDIFFDIAIKEAKKAKNKQEVPVGAIIVREEEIIAKSHNEVEKSKSILSHAEIKAIQKAFKKKKDWRLDDCELYVTLEPCAMCKEAIKRARIKKVYYCIKNTEYKLKETSYLESKNNIQKKEVEKLLIDFFKTKR